MRRASCISCARGVAQASGVSATDALWPKAGHSMCHTFNLLPAGGQRTPTCQC